MTRCQTPENNNNMKKKNVQNHKPNKKEMNFRELSKLKNKTEILK